MMPKSSINIESYNKICDSWQKYRSGTQINKAIVDFTKLLKPKGRILDIGCGTGYPIAKYLSEHGFSVTGIDVSHEMITKAKSLNLENTVFIEKDILNFTSTVKFDGIIAFDCLWHIDQKKQTEIYKILASLMADEAYLLFTHGNRFSEITGTMFGETFYYSALDIATVQSILAECGLNVIFCAENYKEETTGERDLLIIAKKHSK